MPLGRASILEFVLSLRKSTMRGVWPLLHIDSCEVERCLAGFVFWLSILFVLYSYAGYAVIVTVLARLRQPVVYPLPVDPPHITMLIAAYNEQAVIARKLENTLALNYPADRLQVIVAADGSSDATAEVAAGFEDQGVMVNYSPERRGKMAAINRAMPLAAGEIVVFSDANNLYDPDALRHLAAPFADERWGIVTGAKHITDVDNALAASEGLYWKYESFIKKMETRFNTCTAAAGEIIAIRRELYHPPAPKIINDDFILAMDVLRQGYDVYYQPEARSFEPVSASAADERTRRIRIVAGRYQALMLAPRTLPLGRPIAAWQVLSHKMTRPLVPFFMMLALLANLIAVIWPPASAGFASDLLHLAPPLGLILLAVQVVFYLLAAIGTRIESASLLGKLLYLPTFLVSSNTAAVLGLFRYLSGQQTVLWDRVKRRDE